VTESGFNKAWRKARLAAGCPGHIAHDFRRTAVRTLVRAHVPERVSMQMTGHKTRAIFERYNIVSPGDLRDAALRLDASVAGGLNRRSDLESYGESHVAGPPEQALQRINKQKPKKKTVPRQPEMGPVRIVVESIESYR
jgi:hypothetical protein